MVSPPVGQPSGEGQQTNGHQYTNMAYRNQYQNAPASDATNQSSHHWNPAQPNNSGMNADDMVAPADMRVGRHREVGTNGGAGRSRSRTNGSTQPKSPSRSRICVKCNLPLTGQFVRALGGTFHLECFKCKASKT